MKAGYKPSGSPGRIRLSGPRQRLNTGKPLLHGRNRQYDERQGGFRAQIDPVVGEGIDRRAHPVVCGIASEEDHSGEKSKEIAAQYPQQITFDEPVLFVMKDTGET